MEQARCDEDGSGKQSHLRKLGDFNLDILAKKEKEKEKIAVL